MAGERENLGRRTNPAREDLLVVYVALDPAHHLLDIRWGGHLGRPLVVLAILPEVLELVRRLHFGARLRRAEFRNGTVEEVDLVVEVHHWNSPVSTVSFAASAVSSPPFNK